ncbi:hypothetical protein SDC9_169234 [bioreactor metagenome]|uniref:Uncharacterized protein n=1 Tax=bioreactor metagenome TaxID=1076179 RepID=A0A645G7A9_9ZZZZ
MRRTSSSRSPRRCCVARAICCRSARCRSTAPGPAAPRSSRSVVSPRRSRSGIRACASTAASARSSARIRRFASRWPRPTSWKARRTPSSRSPTRTAISRVTSWSSRSPPTIARAAESASMSARHGRRPKSNTSRSTSNRDAITWTPSAPISTSSWESPTSTARRCATIRSRAPPSWSRCSSSRWPAPGAVRRRISARPPSCSATG